MVTMRFNLAKVKVAGSRPVFRSTENQGIADVKHSVIPYFLVGWFVKNPLESSNKGDNHPTKIFNFPLTLTT